MDFETLEETCKGCTKCSLHQTRTNCVFGQGSRNAVLMFVGEAPGEKEDLSGIPFVGPAGQHLNKFLAAVGIDREKVYITNILKVHKKCTFFCFLVTFFVFICYNI